MLERATIQKGVSVLKGLWRTPKMLRDLIVYSQLLQFAGRKLRELEKDMKSMNLGVLFSEGTKRAMRYVTILIKTCDCGLKACFSISL